MGEELEEGVVEPGAGAVEAVGGERGRCLRQQKCYQKRSWIGVGFVVAVAV